MVRLGESRGRTLRTTGALSAVGISFVLAVVIGAGFGHVLDQWLGSSPWFFLLFFFLGMAAGILNVIRISTRCLHEREGDGPHPPAH